MKFGREFENESIGAVPNPTDLGEKVQMPLQRFLSDYRESSVAVVSVFVVLSIAIIAIFAPLLAPTDPYDLAVVTVADKTLAPGVVMSSGQTAYLGTDGSGRDLLSGIFYGLGISLGVGIGSGVIALAIGGVCGFDRSLFWRSNRFVDHAVGRHSVKFSSNSDCVGC
ncbi:MAG: hypothetical protein CM1200mP41_19430 [Gammaproteobacteria bacterium]|nr:MAG: hypothetical protein CM1200mP41_19430 [Gammaproteobacteria bacterium]